MTFSILRGFSLQQKVVTPATVPEYATSSQKVSSVLLNSPSFLLQHHSARFPSQSPEAHSTSRSANIPFPFTPSQMCFQSFHISSQLPPNWSSGSCRPGLRFSFCLCPSCCRQLCKLLSAMQSCSWNKPMHKDCTSALPTDVRVKHPDLRCLVRALRAGAYASLHHPPPWQISWATEDTTEQDLNLSAATGNLLVQNKGNKSRKCWGFSTLFCQGKKSAGAVLPFSPWCHLPEQKVLPETFI